MYKKYIYSFIGAVLFCLVMSTPGMADQMGASPGGKEVALRSWATQDTSNLYYNMNNNPVAYRYRDSSYYSGYRYNPYRSYGSYSYRGYYPSYYRSSSYYNDLYPHTYYNTSTYPYDSYYYYPNSVYDYDRYPSSYRSGVYFRF